MKVRSKKILSSLLKITIFLLVARYIYHHLSSNSALLDFKSLLADINKQHIYMLLSTVVLLMFINWFVEAYKWQYICKEFQEITYLKAVESVFCGLSWAVFTPNRIGEYGGRVLFLSPKKRIFGVIGMGIGAISLMIITNIVGAFSLNWFAYTYLNIKGFWYIVASLFTLIYASFFYILYFRIQLLNTLLLKVKFLQKYERFFSIILRYDHSKLKQIFLYSAIRYIVFTTQYCVLIQVFIPEVPFYEMLMMLFLLFFVQSALPSLDLFDVGVRSITASYFFGFLTEQSIAIMAIAACIWFVNLIIPAIIGSFFTFKINFFGTSNS